MSYQFLINLLSTLKINKKETYYNCNMCGCKMSGILEIGAIFSNIENICGFCNPDNIDKNLKNIDI